MARMIRFPEADFRTVYSYFLASFSATDNAGVHQVMDLEDAAWDIVRGIAEEHGLIEDGSHSLLGDQEPLSPQDNLRRARVTAPPLKS